MGKSWPALDIHVPGCDPELQDLVLAELDDFHPTAIQEPEGEQKLRSFFVTATARDDAARALASAFGTHIFVQALDVPDDDWAERSQANLRAIVVGDITVAPPWDVQSGTPIVIVIQPSMGFGTGHHATTRLMLKAMQTIDFTGASVWDIGCGSGVLATAAAKLGARSVVALDNDPDALESAADTVERNGAGSLVRIQEDDFRKLAQPANIVLANLTGGLLESTAAKLAELVADEGSLVVSGFMQSEPNVVPALERFFTVRDVTGEEEWRCAVLVKPPKT